MPVSHSSNNLKSHAFRLKPHQDLKKEILAWAKKNKIKAGCILTCVGSLEQSHLRFAGQKKGVKRRGRFEIISFVGTFSDTYAHLHLAVADATGKTTGGHLLEDNLVYTTAEIIISELPGVAFLRQQDDTYGYEELVVTQHPTRKKR